MSTAKESRLAVRLSAEQDELIRRAADAEGASITEFTVNAAVSRAQDALADRKVFMLDDAAWHEFLHALDRPAAQKPELAKLFAEDSTFG